MLFKGSTPDGEGGTSGSGGTGYTSGTALRTRRFTVWAAAFYRALEYAGPVRRVREHRRGHGPGRLPGQHRAPGRVDEVRLQRVVDVMRQSLGFGKFDLSSMLMGGGQGHGATG